MADTRIQDKKIGFREDIGLFFFSGSPKVTQPKARRTPECMLASLKVKQPDLLQNASFLASGVSKGTANVSGTKVSPVVS